VDCGEGTQRQILQSGLGFKRLDHVLITHGHLDHILGLAGLVSTFTRWETAERLEIWGGRWALERIRVLLYEIVLKGARLPFELKLCEIKPGLIFNDKFFTVTAFPVQHRGADSFGFVFEEKSKRPFLVEKAEALGVPAGPIRRELVAGRAVTLPDGRVVQPEDVLGPLVSGVKLVHVGDCGETSDLVKVARGADALVIEATYLNSEDDLAREFGHLTAARAALLAREAGVGGLLLTHLSRRNRERDVLEEAQRVFPNTRVARDFDHYQVTKEDGVRKVERRE
jgi:ribonuclease Z